MTDRSGIEVSALDQYICGLLADLGIRASHHAGYRDRAIRIGDGQHFRRELSGNSVERCDLFSRTSTPDDDAVTVQQVKIKRVSGLIHLEHHVVGYIRDVINRALPDRFEAVR